MERRKYALVTGGSRGIGRAACVKLAQMGYWLLINYVSNTAAAEEVLEQVREVGQDGELLQFDVSDAALAGRVLEDWKHRHEDEYIEVLVNNAGIRRDNIMAFMPAEDWRRVLDVTLNGFYNVTLPLLPAMLTHRYGRIVNMASLSGIKGLAGQTNYSAAKGGLIAVTKALAQEVARRNVTVNAIAPGFIRTDMVDGLDEDALKKTIPMRRFGRPEEVAELIGFLTSPQASYITGDIISINGGLYT